MILCTYVAKLNWKETAKLAKKNLKSSLIILFIHRNANSLNFLSYNAKENSKLFQA